ncbi:MAG: hypothetical protein QM606_08705 [Leucobacter sp.]
MNVLSTLNAAVRVAEEAEFDPDKVTPGVPGFFAFAALGVGIILLGFSLVSRLRRNAYRAEVRDQIAEELAGAGDPDSTAGSGNPSGPDGPADPGAGAIPGAGAESTAGVDPETAIGDPSLGYPAAGESAGAPAPGDPETPAEPGARG